MFEETSLRKVNMVNTSVNTSPNKELTPLEEVFKQTRKTKFISSASQSTEFKLYKAPNLEKFYEDLEGESEESKDSEEETVVSSKEFYLE